MSKLCRRFTKGRAGRSNGLLLGTLALCGVLLWTCHARAQVGDNGAAPAKSEYDRGYEAGYQAGLRAAMSLGNQSASGLPSQPKASGNGEPNAPTPPTSPVTATADPVSPPANTASLTGSAKSLWDEMTTHEPDDGTFFHHSQTSPLWLSAQANFIGQLHPRFNSPYRGPNSLNGAEEQAMSRVETLFTGLQLNDTTEFVMDAESSGWSGLSSTLGLGAYVNLDAVRNPELSAEPYLARLWLRKVIPLSDETIEVERDPLALLTTLPARRIDIHVGKMSLPDFFDINSVGGDSHMQFINWAVDNNPAWDYAADTRGYTYATVIDYEDRHWGARFAEALEPTMANGDTLEWNPQHAHAENYEIEVRPTLLARRSTVIRLLAFTNFANMGDYHQAIVQYETNLAHGLKPKAPNIDAHHNQIAMKYGFGLNMEQELTETVRVYSRLGWNEGQHESWAYTECDAHFSFGSDLRGDWWGRPRDKWGVAFVMDGLSANHRRYLSLGGLGFVLGDGNLSYGPEQVMETYYNFPVPIEPGVYAAFDFQYINNPGYNRVRGPVLVPGIRLHLEL